MKKRTEILSRGVEGKTKIFNKVVSKEDGENSHKEAVSQILGYLGRE